MALPIAIATGAPVALAAAVGGLGTHIVVHVTLSVASFALRQSVKLVWYGAKTIALLCYNAIGTQQQQIAQHSAESPTPPDETKESSGKQQKDNCDVANI